MVTVKLKRSLGLPVLVLYGLGNILGAGIYVLVGKVAGQAGPHTIWAFLIAMLIAGLTAFSYMELSSRYPVSGSIAVYLHKAFKKRWLSVLVGMLVVGGGVTSAAALAHGFAGFLTSFITVPELAVALGIIVLLGLVAIKGIGESAWLAAIVTLLEIGGLLLIIWAGFNNLSNQTIGQVLGMEAVVNLSGIMLGAFLAFYAFIGFEDMANVAEEVKNPKRTMPLAILISLMVATVLYLLVVAVSLASALPSELATSSTPLGLVLERTSHLNPSIMAAVGMLAAVNGILVQIIMGSRLIYGLAHQGWISRLWAKLHGQYQTPVRTTVAVVAAILVAAVALPLVSLAQASSFLILIVFGLIHIALLLIKRRGSSKGALQVHRLIPILGAISCFGMLLLQLHQIL